MRSTGENKPRTIREAAGDLALLRRVEEARSLTGLGVSPEEASQVAARGDDGPTKVSYELEGGAVPKDLTARQAAADLSDYRKRLPPAEQPAIDPRENELAGIRQARAQFEHTAEAARLFAINTMLDEVANVKSDADWRLLLRPESGTPDASGGWHAASAAALHALDRSVDAGGVGCATGAGGIL